MSSGVAKDRMKRAANEHRAFMDRLVENPPTCPLCGRATQYSEHRYFMYDTVVQWCRPCLKWNAIGDPEWFDMAPPGGISASEDAGEGHVERLFKSGWNQKSPETTWR